MEQLKSFSETISTPKNLVEDFGTVIEFEDKVYQVLKQMEQAGHTFSLEEVRNFVRMFDDETDIDIVIQKFLHRDDLAEAAEKSAEAAEKSAEAAEKSAEAAEKSADAVVKMGSKDWQRLRDEIERWKKVGGTLAAKSKGTKEIISKKKLTSEEKDIIAATPGIVPPWWKKADGYYKGARKAIEELGVSALDVHVAVERDYTGKVLSKLQKEILSTRWPEVEMKSFSQNINSKDIFAISQQLEYTRKEELRKYIRDNPDMDIYTIKVHFTGGYGGKKLWGWEDINEDQVEAWALKIMREEEREKIAKTEEKRAEKAPELMNKARKYINTHLSLYLGESKQKLPDSKSFYYIQARSTKRLEDEEKKDYIRDREASIREELNKHIHERISGKDIPDVDELQRELRNLIRKADTDFRLTHPIEEYWKRGKERLEKEEKKERERKPAQWRMKEKIAAEIELHPALSDNDLASKISREEGWNITLVLRMILNVREEIEKKKGVKGTGPVPGLWSEHNPQIPKGEYYLPGYGWY